jgi:hypothetical protein
VKLPKAEELKKTWEDAGTLAVAPPMPTSPDPQEPPTFEHVVQQFMNVRKACRPSQSTCKKYRQFADLLKEFCGESDMAYLTQFSMASDRFTVFVQKNPRRQRAKRISSDAG